MALTNHTAHPTVGTRKSEAVGLSTCPTNTSTKLVGVSAAMRLACIWGKRAGYTEARRDAAGHSHLQATPV